jgi:hypothetical protein
VKALKSYIGYHPASMAALTQSIRFCTAHDGVRIAYAVTGQGPPIVRAAHFLTHLDSIFSEVGASKIPGAIQFLRRGRADYFANPQIN